MRIGNTDWSSVYMLEHQPSASAGTDAGRVLLFANAPGAQPGSPAAVLSDPTEVAAALKLARTEERFEMVGNFWMDFRKLRHTRGGSTALLSFALTGGRIATVAVPAEVLQHIQARRQLRGDSEQSSDWNSRRGTNSILVSARG